MASVGAELKDRKLSTEHGKIVDRLRALIALRQDAGGELVRAVAERAALHVFRSDGDFHWISDGKARRQPDGEAMTRNRLDSAELALAIDDAAGR